MGKGLGTALAVMGLVAAGPALAEVVHDASFTAPGGERSLQQWIDIAGPAACVWRQLTDEAALKASGIPMAHVELKVGGLLEEGFTADPKPGETIRHRILTYLPERLLVLRNEAVPPGVPGAELYPSIVQVILVEPREGGVTRLTIAHTGYGKGEKYDQLYAFFHGHNPAFLTGTKLACETGAKGSPSPN